MTLRLAAALWAHWALIAEAHLALLAGEAPGSAASSPAAIPLRATTTDCRWGACAWVIRAAADLVRGDEDWGSSSMKRRSRAGRAMGSDGITIFVLRDFAGWLVDRGETTRARDMLEEPLALAADHPGIWLQASPLAGLALGEAIEGKAEAAARFLSTGERLRASGGVGDIPAHFQHRITRATALARSALGEEWFAAALAEGWSNMPAIDRTP